jgi:hypothetical protein
MSIILLINYARSGGTILSKCLGSMDDIILISEVNPHQPASLSIKEQALKWYNITLKYNDYRDAVLELNDVCLKNNKHLIIRDWTFLDFTPCEQNKFEPTYRLSGLEIIKNDIDIIPFCFVRDAIDVWISRWMPPSFFINYKLYIENIVNSGIPIFKYEDFCINPEISLKKICSTININYSSNYKNYTNYHKVTGDNTNPKISRGAKNKFIQPFQRKRIPVELIRKLNANIDMIESNRLLGYSTNYYDKEIDKNQLQLYIEIKYRLKQILNIPYKDLY